MSGIFGLNIKMSIYGESHGKAIGVVLDGLPPGLALDEEAISREMARRAPGQSLLTTARKEKDAVEIQSGFFNGYPGHGDYAGYVHYQGYNDYRGGGHFSARLTAPLVFAGAVAKQALAQYGITVGAHILRIHDITEPGFNPLGESEATLKAIDAKSFPVINDNIGEQMQNCILTAKGVLNSVGGVIELMAINLPAGLGAPYFDSVESRLSQILFSVPAVKGIEFGEGFGFAQLTGAEANDQMHYEEGKVRCYTNHNGGITGGLTNGMPLVFRVAMKPTPSISREQKTVSLAEQSDTTLTVVGRHDPCIVQRAVPVIEAVTAWTLWDLLIEAKKWEK